MLAALLLGVPALLATLLDSRLAARAAAMAPRAPPRRRSAGGLWGLAGLVLWMVLGAALFSQMAHLHPRYTESITPAVAGTLGIGLAWACARRTPCAPGGARGLPDRPRDLRRAAAVRDPADLVGGDRWARWGRWPWPPSPAREGARWALVLALASLLAVPAWASVRAIEHHTSDTNQLGTAAAGRSWRRCSSYLRSHQGSARYEAAYDSATKLGALVVRDQRPLVVLNSINSQVVTPLSRLRALAAAGARALRGPLGPLLAPLVAQQPRLLDGRALGRGPRHERLGRRRAGARPHAVAAARPTLAGRHG